MHIDWSKVPVSNTFIKQEMIQPLEEEKKDCKCDDWKYDSYGEMRICVKCNRVIKEGEYAEPEPVYRDYQYRAPNL